MAIKAVFFDSGHTLMRPHDNRWFPGPRFFDLCRAHGLIVADDAALQAACDSGYAYLNEHHDQVPDVNAEVRQFTEYYRVVFDALGVAPSDALTQALANAVVSEVNFEPYPSTRGLLDTIEWYRRKLVGEA